MTLTPKEILELTKLAQIQILESFIYTAEHHVHYDDHDKINKIHGENWKKEMSRQVHFLKSSL